MNKFYYSLGLMSGTSGDGVDASIIQSDGDNEYKVISDNYYKYDEYIYKKIHNLKDKIKDSNDLKNQSKALTLLEKEITLFHSKVIEKISKDSKIDIDLIGFHGQTIFHNAKEKISKQLGDGKLLSKLAKKTVVYNFRKNDLNNGGQGAPLTPLFHKILAKKYKINPALFLNLGGIANLTNIQNQNDFTAKDVGPGMCLIDSWIRFNTKKNYDENGDIGKSGRINELVLYKELDKLFYKNKNLINSNKKISYDTKDFNLNFIKELSLENGTATLTEYTVKILANSLMTNPKKKKEIILCGGGRKNNFLVERIKKNNILVKFIDEFGIDGDFIESQAFAYLAIRSFLGLPISYPKTTGVNKPCVGGIIIKT